MAQTVEQFMTETLPELAADLHWQENDRKG